MTKPRFLDREVATKLLDGATDSIVTPVISLLLIAAIALIAVVLLTASPAGAKESRYYHRHRHHHSVVTARASADANGNTTVIAHPAGCPPREFCGCGLRKYLGIADKSLDLAWNWARKFAHTFAHAGAAAVRRHHVMLLVSHVAGTTWVVRDYNGGHHLSFIHPRNVSGYVFVDPTTRVASR